MKKQIILFIWLVVQSVSAQTNLKYVDPMIGTDAHGHTFPGATTPFGMIQLSPSNGWKGWDWCAGYHYSDTVIKGFAHNHVSGAGLSGLGDILLMPTMGKLQVIAGTDKNPELGYCSRFSHLNEKASAGYYSVLLDDDNILVELTATTRVGFHRYTFQNEGEGHVIIDPSYGLDDVTNAELEIISENEIRGIKYSNGQGGVRKTYFYAHFSKPFNKSGFAINDTVVGHQSKINGKNIRAWVNYKAKKGDVIEVKVALSFVSYEGAVKNYKAEAQEIDFNVALSRAQKTWNEKLDKISISGTDTEKRIFYTSMYHSLISPNIISDVDGNYIVEGKKYHSDFDQYSTFSSWDTFRAFHPLMTILETKKTADWVNSLTSRYTISKVGLPVWEFVGHDNICMIGYSTTSLMSDAILKNIPGIDVENAYKAMHAASFSLEKNSPNYDANGMSDYVKLGYVTSSVGCSVSKTTEQNYYDWAIGKVAEKLGKTADATLYANRSKSFLNLYNPEKQYLWPKMPNGEWLEMNLSKWDDLIRNYVSGNIWAYSAFYPHSMGAMINKMEGRKNYEIWLDKIFSDTTQLTGGMHVDISGFIGKYGHGDEPGHQMSYLYNYVGAPYKTQRWVHKITKSMYSDKPDGVNNNDDLGQMSSWYIFSTLGFYPVCPGSLQYVIGSPHFTKVAVKTEAGKVFTILAKNASSVNIYIQSVRLNGKKYELPFITHNNIMSGGLLEFEMSDKPSNWGAGEKQISKLVGNQL